MIVALLHDRQSLPVLQLKFGALVLRQSAIERVLPQVMPHNPGALLVLPVDKRVPLQRLDGTELLFSFLQVKPLQAENRFDDARHRFSWNDKEAICGGENRAMQAGSRRNVWPGAFEVKKGILPGICACNVGQLL